MSKTYTINEKKYIVKRSYDTNGPDFTKILLEYLYQKIVGDVNATNESNNKNEK